MANPDTPSKVRVGWGVAQSVKGLSSVPEIGFDLQPHKDHLCGQTPVISAPERLRQLDRHDFESSMDSRVSSRQPGLQSETLYSKNHDT